MAQGGWVGGRFAGLTRTTYITFAKLQKHDMGQMSRSIQSLKSDISAYGLQHIPKPAVEPSVKSVMSAPAASLRHAVALGT